MRSYIGYTALYGGSFDPPHVGHQMACLVLLSLFEVKQVWMLPVFQHPLGKPLTNFAHRVAMCRKLLLPFGQHAVVSSLEKTLGENRTYEVVLRLQKRFPKRRFCLAVGADVLAEAPKWHRYRDLEKLLPIVVLGRATYVTASPLVEIPNISSSEVRERLLGGQAISGLVPASVAAYITEHQLYVQHPKITQASCPDIVSTVTRSL